MSREEDVVYSLSYLSEQSKETRGTIIPTLSDLSLEPSLSDNPVSLGIGSSGADSVDRFRRKFPAAQM